MQRYLRVRPLRAGDWARFTAAVVRSGWARARDRSLYLGPGQFLAAPMRLRVGGLQLKVRPRSDDLEYATIGHKPAVEAWFRPSPDELVVDVGAHIGYFSLMAAKGGSEVVAIEPNPAVCEVLRTNVRENRLGNVRVECWAAGEREGRTALRFPRLASGLGSVESGWIDPSTLPPSTPMEATEVEVRPLDALLDGWGDRRVDWLLVDVESGERAVLRGAARLLRRTARLILEVADPEVFAPELEAMIRGAGMERTDVLRQNPRTEYWFCRRDRAAGSDAHGALERDSGTAGSALSRRPSSGGSP